MKYKSIVILIFITCVLFSISCVCAGDMNETAAIGNEEAHHFPDGELQGTEVPMTFSDLNQTINGNDDIEIILNDDYKFKKVDNGTDDVNFTSGIVINRSVTIDGKGHEIDGNNLARIFDVKSEGVIFKNISFVNGNVTGNGGAIMGDCVAINCNFTHNVANREAFFPGIIFPGGSILGPGETPLSKENGCGGAMYGGSAYDCIFTGNVAQKGGAMYNTSAYNCVFRGNGLGSSKRDDGSQEHVNITGIDGGAMYGGAAYECEFIQNKAGFGGALYDCDAFMCIFDDNDGSYGGALKGGSSDSSIFKTIYDTARDANVSNPVFTANNLATHYMSGDRLTFDLKTANGTQITNKTIRCMIYDIDDVWLNITFNVLSDDGWAVDLPAGSYIAVCTVDDYGITSNATLRIYDDSIRLFRDLNKTVNSGDSDIYLDYEYVFDSFCDSEFSEGIIINRSVTVHGNGHTINANSRARIFSIAQNVRPTFANLTFANANTTGDGGAINGWSYALNCTFINNSAGRGGAIADGYAEGCIFTDNRALESCGGLHGGTAKNCTFKNNHALNSGAMNNQATDCMFVNNTATYEGGAMNGIAENCTFINNSAESGGAMGRGSASKCTFINNTAVYGGAMCNNVIVLAEDCIFINNSAEYGGAFYMNGYEYYLENCVFRGNHAKNAECGGAVYNKAENAVVDSCIFENESDTCVGIENLKPVLTMRNTTFVYGSLIRLWFVLTTNGGKDLVNETINVDFYDSKHFKFYNVTTLSGTFITSISNLPVDYYFLICGVDRYNATYNITVTVKSPTSINVSDIAGVYNVESYLVITLRDYKNDPVAGVNVTVRLDGVNTYPTDENGTVKVPTVGLDAGNYTALVTFGGEGFYNASCAEASVAIAKATAKLNATSFVISYGGNLEMTILDGQGRPVEGVNVTVDLGGAKDYVSDANGTVRVSTAGLDAGNYVVKVTVSGSNYVETTGDVNVTVVSLATKLDVNAPVVTYNINKYLIVSLKDANGNPIAGASVSIDLNGVKSYVTDNNGQIKVNAAKLVPKTYEVKITFDGSANYMKSHTTAKLTVMKAAPKLTAKKKTFKAKTKTKKYSVTLKDNRGKAIGKVKVTLKIKGKKAIAAKTNGKGKATFKIKKLTKKGNYSAKVSFKGDKYFKSASKNVKITVKK